MALESSISFRVPAPNIEMRAFLQKDCILFYTPETKKLAEAVQACSEGKVQLGEIMWK
jgi:hypothetical protein